MSWPTPTASAASRPGRCRCLRRQIAIWPRSEATRRTSPSAWGIWPSMAQISHRCAGRGRGQPAPPASPCAGRSGTSSRGGRPPGTGPAAGLPGRVGGVGAGAWMRRWGCSRSENEVQSQGSYWAYRALAALLMARDQSAMPDARCGARCPQSAIRNRSARRALELAEETARTTIPSNATTSAPTGCWARRCGRPALRQLRARRPG